MGVLQEAEVIEIPEGMELERDEDELESEDEEVPRVSRVRKHKQRSSHERRNTQWLDGIKNNEIDFDGLERNIIRL